MPRGPHGFYCCTFLLGPFVGLNLLTDVQSFHDDYFVELQKELAVLIAAVVVQYSPVSETPRNILLSLPGMNPEQVDSCIRELLATTTSRVQRSLVLRLLENIRGV